MKTITKNLGFTAHLEPVKVDNGVADYCMKEETRFAGPWEYGKQPKNKCGKLDWDKVKQ